MNVTISTGDSDTSDTSGTTDVGSFSYVLGLTFAFIVLIILVSYVSYKCNRIIRFSSPPDGTNDHHLITVSSGGINDDVLDTFPAFTYSELMNGDSTVDGYGSGCSICLVDYKPADIIRLLPECDHLFHRKCIDTWLKFNASCPVCRNSPLPVKLSIQRS
ncbi:hypothetical protein QVD17_23323 [Tagetes erecta]|uniref:RING-type domain-containing protein n=1 Tax=Tagetes erecta TaxID=13708 RepID=A0AAD8KDW6_TARER|nr:hypothetical protein QVD17_23323 [Tagetes erecta]